MTDSNIDELSLMFEASRSLIAGAKIVVASDGIEEEGHVRHPTLPVIVCSGLAIEIQLKLLLKLCKRPRPSGDGHDLNSLFDALPPDLQSEILASESVALNLPVDEIRTKIKAEANVFKTWRYPYEKEMLQTEPAFLVDFAIILSQFIATKAPIERSANGWISDRRSDAPTTLAV